MIEKTRHAHTNYTLLKPYINAANLNGGAVRFKAPGFMDLTVENLQYSGPYGNPVYSMPHYGKQNGDAMRDPDMAFSFDSVNGRVIPLTFRNDYMGVYQEVIKTLHGKQLYSVSLLRDLDEFLWMWLRNIREQGFTLERLEII